MLNGLDIAFLIRILGMPMTASEFSSAVLMNAAIDE